MTLPSSIITELPSCLWNSPLFEAYDYYVSDTSAALEDLHGDLEEMFHLKDVNQTALYLLNLKHLLTAGIRARTLEDLSGFNRLIYSTHYTQYPADSVFWLFKLVSKIHILRNPFIQTGLTLKIGDADNAVALIRPLVRSTPSPSFGASLSF